MFSPKRVSLIATMKRGAGNFMTRFGRLTLAFSFCLAARLISAQVPLINAGGVVNVASYAQPGVLAPGELFSVFGTSLSDGSTGSGASSFPTRLAGARVLVNGTAAPCSTLH